MDDHDTPTPSESNLNNLEQFKNEASSAEMGEATLAGVRGLGTLHVVRDQDGGIYEVAGTWRLPDDVDERDLSKIHAAHEQGTPILYKGKLSDARKPDKDHIEVEVTITSVQSYTFDATEESPDTERTLYNYDIAGKLPYKVDPEEA